jgi:hypothetical protein
VGEEFELVAEARGHALAVARELSHNDTRSRFAGRHISVVDELGVVVFTVLLQVAVVLVALLAETLGVFADLST